MESKARYRLAMEWLYLACIVVSGTALIIITLIIPYGVFMRYVVQSPSSWPEPLAILLMVVFTFVGGAAVYRAKQHIAVMAMLNAVSAGKRRALLMAVDVCMAATCAFMVYYGAQLVKATWHQVIAEFPELSVGITYLPVPVGGFLALLFILEHVWAGDPPPTSIMYSDAPTDLE